MRHSWSTRLARPGWPRARVGSVFEDVWDTVTSPVEDAWKAMKDNVPGFQEVADAVDAVVDGPVRDFARTAVGQTVLSIAASSLTGGLAPVLGPQLCTVAFALPGMAAGEPFAQAWTQEFCKRVEQTAAILGSEYAGKIAGEALAKLKTYSDKFNADGLDFHKLAKLAGVREDYAAIYLAGWIGDMRVYADHLFDERTGEELVQHGFMGMGDALAQIQAANEKAWRDKIHALGVEQEKRGMLASKDNDLTAFLRANDLSNLAGSGPAQVAVNASPAPVRAAAPPPSPGLSTPAKIGLGVGVVGLLAGVARALRWV